MSADKKVKKKSRAQASKENGALGGRPKIEFTQAQWNQIEECCRIHCTGEEIAGIIGVDYDTLVGAIKDATGLGFSGYFNQKSAGGKMSLRRTQYTQAMNGNATMLIWLGKNWLEQKDKTEISGDEEKPIVLAYPLPK